MAPRRIKAVFSAEPDQVRRIRLLVKARRYRSTSALVREAIDEKLERLRRETIAEQVDRYCVQGLADEDDGLVAVQAFARRR